MGIGNADSLSHDVALRPFQPSDQDSVLKALLANEEYSLAMTGYFPEPGDLESMFYALPIGADPSIKHVWVVTSGVKVVGIIDMLVGWPNRQAVSVGWFCIDPSRQRHGIASQALAAGLDMARLQGLHLLRVTCPRQWDVGCTFLKRQGFVPSISSSEVSMNRVSHQNEAEILIDSWSLQF